jgi:hypothetical protein
LWKLSFDSHSCEKVQFIVAIVVSLFSVMLKLEKSLRTKGMLSKRMDCLSLIILHFSVDPALTRIKHSGDANRAFAHRQHGSEHLMKDFLLRCLR